MKKIYDFYLENITLFSLFFLILALVSLFFFYPVKNGLIIRLISVSIFIIAGGLGIGSAVIAVLEHVRKKELP